MDDSFATMNHCSSINANQWVLNLETSAASVFSFADTASEAPTEVADSVSGELTMEICVAANANLLPVGSFVAGLLDGITAPATVIAHQSRLSSGDPATETVDALFQLGLEFIPSNFSAVAQIAGANLTNNIEFVSGRTISSAAIGALYGGGLGGRTANALVRSSFGRHAQSVGRLSVGSGVIANLTLSQTGGALQALYSLQSQANAAGIPINLLSSQAIADAVIAGAAGLNASFDPETGMISVCN